LAIIPGSENPLALDSRGEDAAGMSQHSPRLAIAWNDEKVLFAQHEKGGGIEKMRRDNRRAGVDRPGTRDDGGSIVAAVGHAGGPQPEGSLVWRFRSPHHSWPPSRRCGLPNQSHTRSIKLLVSFDSEVRQRGCRRMRRGASRPRRGSRNAVLKAL